MIFIQHYDSPLGGILLAADETGLTGLWLDLAKNFCTGLASARRAKILCPRSACGTCGAENACPFGSQTLAGQLLYR